MDDASVTPGIRRRAASTVESGKVEQAAKAAAQRNAQEEAGMRKTEAKGRSHAKGTKSVEEGDALTPGRKPGEDASGDKTLGKPKPGKLQPAA